MEDRIYVTKSSMPNYEEYCAAIKLLWQDAFITNMGKYHDELEKSLIAFLNVDKISLFCNGHMSLELLLQAMGLTGEVITTPFTFVSTTHAIVRNGLKPVFCDINPHDFTINTDKIEELITENTSAILPVHVYGNICDITGIQQIADKYNLKVIYDAAHAFGITYHGRGVADYGDASILSFHATKIFHTIEGGAVVYHNAELGKSLYDLKNFGIRSEEIVAEVGANAKMNEFQAIMGLCNLKRIDAEIEKRKLLTKRYLKNLKGMSGIKVKETKNDGEDNYGYFPIVCEENLLGFSRDDLYKELARHNIYGRKYFYPLTSDQACFRNKYKDIPLPVARKTADRILTLPLYAGLSTENVDRICKILWDMVSAHKKSRILYGIHEKKQMKSINE